MLSEQANLVDPRWTTLEADSTRCSLKFDETKAKLMVSLSKFRALGMGDCPQEEKAACSLNVSSSNFVNFVNGDATVFYMYALFTQYHLLESAAAEMPAETSGDSDCSAQAASRPNPLVDLTDNPRKKIRLSSRDSSLDNIVDALRIPPQGKSAPSQPCPCLCLWPQITSYSMPCSHASMVTANLLQSQVSTISDLNKVSHADDE